MDDENYLIFTRFPIEKNIRTVVLVNFTSFEEDFSVVC